MSSIVNGRDDICVAHSCAVTREAHGEVVRHCRAIGRHAQLEPVAVALDDFRDRTGAGVRARVRRRRRAPSAAAEGSTAPLRPQPLRKRASTSPLTSRRRSTAAAGPTGGSPVPLAASVSCAAGSQRRASIAPSSSSALTMIVLPYDVSHSDASVGNCSTEAATPDAEQQRAPTATRRWRSAARRPPGLRLAARRARLRQSTSRPIEAADPERAGDEVQPVERERERARRSSAPHDRRRRARAERRRAASVAPQSASSARDRALLAFGPVEPQARRRAATREQREHELEVEKAAAERGHAQQWHERAE